MSSLQHLIGIILFHGNASKQVSSLQRFILLMCLIVLLEAQKRLARLQLSVSTTATLKKMDELSEGYDAPVRAWKAQVEETLNGNLH